MSEVESLIANAHQDYPSNNSKEEDKEERKDIVYLKKQLEELIKEKQELKAEYNNKIKEYIEQQSQVLTCDWIEKQKEKLLKRRAKETALIKVDREKCEKLIDGCLKIAREYKQVCSPEEDKGPPLSQAASQTTNKKKSRKRKKKKEVLIGAVALDVLAESFKYFSIAPPKKKEDLEKSIEQLRAKLNEINGRKLTETIGIGHEDFESHSANSSGWSYAT